MDKPTADMVAAFRQLLAQARHTPEACKLIAQMTTWLDSAEPDPETPLQLSDLLQRGPSLGANDPVLTSEEPATGTPV